MTKYRVFVNTENIYTTVIEADSEAEAEEIAQNKWANEEDKAFKLQSIDEYWEVNKERTLKEAE